MSRCVSIEKVKQIALGRGFVLDEPVVYKNIITPCSECSGKKKKTQAEAEAICKSRGCELLSEYKNNHAKVKIKWVDCQHIEFKVYSSMQRGIGCGECFGLKKKTQAQAESLCKSRGCELLSEYKGALAKVKIKWVDCQHTEFKVYSILQQGRGCGECSGTKKLTQAQAESFCKSKGCELLSEYENANVKVKIKWVNCQHVEYKRCGDLQQNIGCGKCWAEATRSNAEIEIFDFVKSLCPDAISSDRDQIYRELDIYVPSQKVGIEYNGLFWHSAKQKSNNYHLDKLQRCEAKDIRLITIFENEWLTRPEVVKAYLRSILSKPENRVFARKCVLQKVTWKEIKHYLDQNHIQGRPANSQHSYVLKHDNQIIAGMTFSYIHSRNSNNYKKRAKTWELTRYCVKSNYQIIGGFQKLFKAFLREVNPEEILSFSDRRWSVGGLYERSNFKLDKIYKPSYWYFENGQHHKLHHKSGFQKKSIAKKLGELLPNETESEAMDRFGYEKIYDCGLIRWVWTNK